MKKRTHLIIPDTQFKPGRSYHWIMGVGRLIKEKRPDVIVQMGDWYDMHSLSSYDRGRRAAEGARVLRDIEVGNAALQLLESCYASRSYRPRKVFLIGNHEQRIERYIEDHPELEGQLGYHLLDFENLGWEVYDFLVPVKIDGVLYSHYFVRSANGGRVTQGRRGNPAKIQVMREHASCTSGHQQGFDYYEHYTSTGRHQGLVVGSCYPDEHRYLTPQGVNYWRGVVLKTFEKPGQYNFERIGIKEIIRRSKL